ncbi:MAG: PIG-L deacetylase family protein [bacterium]|nr:PIG-L deacetylase family protein [bacterium]
MRRFRPVNPELALFEGRHLVRGARRVLAVTAHPDDLEAVAGGTLRLMALAGSTIDVAMLTGGEEQSGQRSNLGQIRRLEERHAAGILGYAEVHALGFRDLSLSRASELESRLGELWERVQPEVVFSFDPSFPDPLLAHPDHLTAGRVTLNLARRDPRGAPRVYFYGTRDTNVMVDIGPVINDKIRAVLAHRSQLKLPPAVYGLLLRAYARLYGSPIQALYGEGFRALSLPRPGVRAGASRWTPRRRFRPVPQRPRPVGPGIAPGP